MWLFSGGGACGDVTRYRCYAGSTFEKTPSAWSLGSRPDAGAEGTQDALCLWYAKHLLAGVHSSDHVVCVLCKRTAFAVDIVGKRSSTLYGIFSKANMIRPPCMRLCQNSDSMSALARLSLYVEK